MKTKIANINRTRIIGWIKTLQPDDFTGHTYKGQKFYMKRMHPVRYSDESTAFFQYEVHIKNIPSFIVFGKNDEEALFFIKKHILWELRLMTNDSKD